MSSRRVILLLLLLAPACGCAGRSPATRPPTSAPSHDPKPLCVQYTAGGGIAGNFKRSVFASADVSLDEIEKQNAQIREIGDRNLWQVTRLSPAQAADVAELLRRQNVLRWPAGIAGRGEWHDNYHYFLDITLDGRQHHIHAAGDGPTAREAERVRELMERIESITTSPAR